MEYELYDEGLTYRYVYGEDKLGVTVYPILNGSASVTTPEDTIPLYYHMGSSEFLTNDVTQRVTSWTSYDEWGNITHNAVLKCGQRELDLVKNYTGHERDSVLGMYYAKARLYDTADKHGSTKGNKLGNKRFMAVDPVKGDTHNPQSMVQYIYTLNDPMMYVDLLGEFTLGVGVAVEAHIISVSTDTTAMLVVDDYGKVAIVTTYAFGGSVGDTVAITPEFGAAIVAGATKADSVYDLVGDGGTVGGAIGKYSLDVSTGRGQQGQSVTGITVGKGSSTVLVEMHGKKNYTDVKVIYDLGEVAEANLPDAIRSELGMTPEEFYQSNMCALEQAREMAAKYSSDDKKASRSKRK